MRTQSYQMKQTVVGLQLMGIRQAWRRHTHALTFRTFSGVETRELHIDVC